MSQDRAKLDAIRALIIDLAEQFSREVFPVSPRDVKVSGADILAILDNDQPERVVGIYDGKRGTVDQHSYNNYAYVIWDDGTRYYVSEDSIMPESELEVPA